MEIFPIFLYALKMKIFFTYIPDYSEHFEFFCHFSRVVVGLHIIKGEVSTPRFFPSRQFPPYEKYAVDVNLFQLECPILTRAKRATSRNNVGGEVSLQGWKTLRGEKPRGEHRGGNYRGGKALAPSYAHIYVLLLWVSEPNDDSIDSRVWVARTALKPSK